MRSSIGNKCGGKVIYSTYWRAERAAKKLNRMSNMAHANGYKCSTAQHFHVGNTLNGRQHGTRIETTKRNIKLAEDEGLFCDGDTATSRRSDWDS